MAERHGEDRLRSRGRNKARGARTRWLKECLLQGLSAGEEDMQGVVGAVVALPAAGKLGGCMQALKTSLHNCMRGVPAHDRRLSCLVLIIALQGRRSCGFCTFTYRDCCTVDAQWPERRSWAP